MEKPPGPRIMRRLCSNTCERTQSKEKEPAEDSSYPKDIEVEKQLWRPFHIWKVLTILWLRLKTTKFINRDESSSFRTKISGYDPQIYPGTLLFFWLLVSCPSKITLEGHLRRWKPGTKPRSRRLGKNKSLVKHAGIRHGRHISLGNEVLYIDPLNKGIHGDENDVKMWLATTFRHYCHLPFWCDTWDCFSLCCCVPSTTFCLALLRMFCFSWHWLKASSSRETNPYDQHRTLWH